LALGTEKVKVIYTPGHTQDSICLYDGVDLLTGDTLFIGNCGRTDLPGGSTEQLFESLHNIILKLPPSTRIYPGHDYGDVPSRKLGEEATLNPTLRVRSLGEFAGVE
jgi:glyoxylase-like metal-dependent hydrolase (beta-lactamase superfamily II)